MPNVQKMSITLHPMSLSYRQFTTAGSCGVLALGYVVFTQRRQGTIAKKINPTIYELQHFIDI